MNNMYKIKINNKCNRCGICKELHPTHFNESISGKIYLKKEIIDENEKQLFSSVLELCLPGAIEFDLIVDTQKKDKKNTAAQIKVLINDSLRKIKVPTLDKKDYMVMSDDIKLNVSFRGIRSDYKYKSSELATLAGVTKLKNILSTNKDAVAQSAMIDYQIKVLNKFINQNDDHYFFKNTEYELKKIISEIKFLLEDIGIKGIAIDDFIVDFKKMDNYVGIAEFKDWRYNVGVSEIMGYDYYVNWDSNSDFKYYYEITTEKINQCFEDMIFDMYTDYVEKDVEPIIRNLIREYEICLFEYLEKLRNQILPKIESILSGYNSEKNKSNYADLKLEIRKIIDKVRRYNWGEIKAQRGNIREWYISDYEYKSFSSAYDHGEKKADRLYEDTKRELKEYANRLGKVVADEIIQFIENILGEIQNVHTLHFEKLSKKDLNINLSHQEEIKADMDALKINDADRRKIEAYCINECINKMELIGRVIYIAPDVKRMDDMYIGDGLFGRMKFATRYNYEIDGSRHLKEINKKYTEIEKYAKDKLMNDITQCFADSIKRGFKC